MTETSLKFTVIGIGETGIKALCSMNKKSPSAAQYIALDTAQKNLDICDSALKIKFGKKQPPQAAAEKIESELEKKAQLADLMFVIFNPAEDISEELIYEILCICEEMGASVIPVTLKLFSCEEKLLKRKTDSFIEKLGRMFPAVIVPMDNIGYFEAVQKFDFSETDREYPEYGESALWNESLYKECLRKSTKITRKNIESAEINEEIIAWPVSVIIEMLSRSYANRSEKEILDILSTPGKLHIEKVSAEGKARAEVAFRRLLTSDLLDTEIGGAKNVLLHMSVPSDFGKEEMKYICENIMGRTDDSMSSIDISIDVSKPGNGRLELTAIATDAFDAEGSEQKYMEW